MAYIRGKYYAYMDENGLHVIKEGNAISFIHGEKESVEAAMAIREALNDFLIAEGVSGGQYDPSDSFNHDDTQSI